MISKLLVSPSGKVFYVRDLAKDYHCQFGFFKADELKKASDGQKLVSSSGEEFYVISPGFSDHYRKIRRGPQIIPLKDLPSIIAVAGIGKESRVLDAGSGSGSLAVFLANIAKEVYSYEVREDFARIAEQNAKELKLNNLQIKVRDVYSGIDERDIDLVVLDLPDPWKAVGPSFKALKVGGYLVSYSPTVPQVADFVASLKDSGFVYIKTIEVIEREWEVNERKVRPKSASIGHSGFLTFARKISQNSL